MGKKSFLIDVDKCSGCELCTIACKDEHVGSSYAPWTKPQPDTGHFWMRVQPVERGRIPRVRMSYLPLLCQHCENAACMKACPEEAIRRRADGLVWIEPEKCTACGLCLEACPYGVIYMNAQLGIAQKCSGCAHRVDAGSLPRCVEICPHEAMVFADEADGAFGQAQQDPALEIYHPEYQAQPRVRWKNLPKPWIAGTLVDTLSDEVIPGAAISAVDLFEDASVSVVSDAFGDYWLKGLGMNRKYKLEIKKDGYEDFYAIVTTEGEQDLGDICLKRTR